MEIPGTTDLLNIFGKIANVVEVLKSEEIREDASAAITSVDAAIAHMKDSAELTVKIAVKVLQAAGVLEPVETRGLADDPRVAKALAQLQ